MWTLAYSKLYWRKTNELHRISDIEKKIGYGLIEEVIQVAEGELKLVDEMYRSKV